MFGDLEFLGETSYGFPIYRINNTLLVDTGCGTAEYNEDAFGTFDFNN